MLDALKIARKRGTLLTALDTAGVRELDAAMRARAVFVARGTNAIFLGKLKNVIDLLAGGEIGEADARVILRQTLDAVGYTPEGGFPDDSPGLVPPAVRGSLQDLSSFQRLNLIVRTQLDLMRGAGQQMRGHERLTAFPAWELVRYERREVPRDWQARWAIAGGKLYAGRMIALKGDPVWGELGSSGNFDDALDVDYPPFAFNSGMGWKEISDAEVENLGVVGPEGETVDEFHRGEDRPATLTGKLPMPSPKLSLEGVPQDLQDAFKASAKAVPNKRKPVVFDYSAILERELAAAAEHDRRKEESP